MPTRRTVPIAGLVVGLTSLLLLLAGCLQAGQVTAPTVPGTSAAVTATVGSAVGSAVGSGAVSSGAAPSTTKRVPASTDPVSGLPWVAESALPPEARRTLALIRAGGPYAYPRNDGVTFGNREGLLPAKPHGYYREYTVTTPGSTDRGPRRIVAGPTGETYYTEDHYASFRRIQEGQ